ncbi:hypothetical protein NSB23_01075 [Phocaeicola vulgatus]|uniref:hypothetical protein n=1 Tax=Phocaeicola vulgatus TaxID=821 RepID=UPI00192A906B|nr:hypothetical protein [Phocaeicola vulgatus]MCR1855658.1 hypothetical protein [Phocaeicola vulgatus]QQY42327.1 hypothetical protein I6I56_21570 [Phocaeicola vulgatus]
MNPTSKGCLLTATALLTDRRQPDFLVGVQFAVCPVIASAMDFRQKEERNGLRTEHQNPASSVSRSSFLSSDFPPVACFRCRMLFKRVVGSGKVFGLNTLKLV